MAEQYSDYETLNNNAFRGKMRKAVRLNRKIKALKEQLDEVRGDMIEDFKAAGATTVIGLDHMFILNAPEKGRMTLNKKKLLKKISVEDLNECYSEGKVPTPSISIRAAEGGDDDEDE